MIKIYELILMHSYRYLNTVFQLVIAIGYGKEYYELFKISHFCVTAQRKERKSTTGHGNDLKLIESYSAPPAITQHFLQLSLITSSTFFSVTYSDSTTDSKKTRLGQQSTNVYLSTALDLSDSAFHSCIKSLFKPSQRQLMIWLDSINLSVRNVLLIVFEHCCR